MKNVYALNEWILYYVNYNSIKPLKKKQHIKKDANTKTLWKVGSGSVNKKAFANKPDDLKSISGTYVVEGKKESLKVVLWCPYMHHGTYDFLNKQMLKTKETDRLEK